MRTLGIALCLCVSTVVASSLLLGCDETPATPAAPASATEPTTPVPTAPPPTVPSEAPPPPRPKKTLEDCPQGPEVTFPDAEFEAAVRLKLQKDKGSITQADLKRLRSLNLSQMKLAELDVCLFTHMTGLKELFLGRGSYDDLSPIAGATQLESLRASLNQVSDLTPLGKMTKMDRLDLGQTQVKDLKPLAEMTALTELQLDGTPVEDVSVLANMTKLERLSLKRTQVKDVSALAGLTDLKFVYIGGSPLDNDVMSVAPLRKNGTKILSD